MRAGQARARNLGGMFSGCLGHGRKSWGGGGGWDWKIATHQEGLEDSHTPGGTGRQPHTRGFNPFADDEGALYYTLLTTMLEKKQARRTVGRSF